MVVTRIFSLVLVIGATSACLDQYNPFPYWKKLEEERVAAHNYGQTTGFNGERKYLAEDGSLVVESAATAAQASPESESAEHIFTSFCSNCHAKDGKGVAGMNARNFTDEVWQNETPDEDIALVIREGTMAIKSGKFPEAFAQMQARKSYKNFTGAMAPSGGRFPPLTDAQIQEMIPIIRAFKGK